MKCTIADCTLEARGHGWCSKHYTRWRNYGDPTFIKRPQSYDPGTQCYAQGCAERPRSKGLCEKHYCRLRAHGDPNMVLVDARPAVERWRDLYIASDLGYASPCWLWTGRISNYGYGRIKNRRNSDGNVEPLAHRFVYEQVIGPIPDDMTLDHLCHNADESCNDGVECLHRRCVNPEHLEVVSSRVNLFRGRTAAAINAAKTHCKWGHEFTPENTLLTGKGRHCKACVRRRMQEHRARKRKKE